MSAFWYLARDDRGHQCTGIYQDIEDVKLLRSALSKAGYQLIKAHPARNQTQRRDHIPQQDVVTFAHQFSQMYSAGLSVLQCLETLEKQTVCRPLKDILTDVKGHVEIGWSLKRAFEPHEHIFSKFFIGMIGAGESGAKLMHSLEISAHYLKKRMELQERVKSAFTYPTIVMMVSVIVLGGLLTYVVPMFDRMYDRLHVTLPWPTQWVLVISQIIRQGVVIWLPVMIGLILGAVKLMSKQAVKAKWDRISLGLPFFGYLNRMVVVSRFLRTFSALISVGVSLIEALELASLVSRNEQMLEISRQMQQAIQAGRPVAHTMQTYDLFPPMVIQMADTGEQSGTLPKMLERAADFLDEDIDHLINRMLIRLEPVLTVALGMFIGLVLLAVYLPMFDYMRQIQ